MTELQAVALFVILVAESLYVAWVSAWPKM